MTNPIIETIEQVFSDTSVPQSTTKRLLEEAEDRIAILKESLTEADDDC